MVVQSKDSITHIRQFWQFSITVRESQRDGMLRKRHKHSEAVRQKSLQPWLRKLGQLLYRSLKQGWRTPGTMTDRDAYRENTWMETDNKSSLLVRLRGMPASGDKAAY